MFAVQIWWTKSILNLRYKLSDCGGTRTQTGLFANWVNATWLWVWIPPQLLKFQILRLFWARNFLTLKSVDAYVAWKKTKQKTQSQWKYKYLLKSPGYKTMTSIALEEKCLMDSISKAVKFYDCSASITGSIEIVKSRVVKSRVVYVELRFVKIKWPCNNDVIALKLSVL